MRRNDALIKEARSEALEWAIAIDQLLNAIIAEYFVSNEWKRQFFEHEILTREFMGTSRKIGILADLETARGTTFRKKYRTMIRQLEELNSYRNLLAHGLPIPLPPASVWIHRGKMKPIPVNRAIVQRMEKKYERAIERLSSIYAKMIRKKHSS